MNINDSIQAIKKGDNKLTSVNLVYFNVGPHGAISLVEALKENNHHIKSINIAYNEIGNEGAKALWQNISKWIIKYHMST